MMEYSTNLTAEMVGLQASGAPDLVASAKAMQAWAAAQGIAALDLPEYAVPEVVESWDEPAAETEEEGVEVLA